MTKVDEYPLPRDDCLDLLLGHTYFSTLDLASGYWQVAMAEESQEKTVFVTHNGLYEFAVMSFGLCNAPATFQRLMSRVLKGLINEKCMVYLDDILVMGQSFAEHISNLQEVFNRLRDANLCLKPKKCHFVKREVLYPGYVVSESGISADKSKVEAVEKFPVPTSVKQVRSFVGLASYYRHFIPGFSKIAGPLFALTKKDSLFEWSPSCQQAFERLKQLLTTAPILIFPDFKKRFILETDASGVGLGAVLSQKQLNGRLLQLLTLVEHCNSMRPSMEYQSWRL